jgi:hypothetical protein
MTHNHTLIVDSHDDVEAGTMCSIDYEAYAVAQLILSTSTGLREVSVCDAHDDMTATDLLVWSEPLDQAQADLETDLFLACLPALIAD